MRRIAVLTSLDGITRMGTFNAFYVRSCADDDAMVAAIRAKFAIEEIEADIEFWGVQLPEEAYVPPERDLADLSARLKTDVIWLSFQSAVDAFQFHHWREGKHLRSLVYGCFKEERTWERVEGIAAPWEREILFNRKRLVSHLKFVTDASEKRELERVYRDADISPGQTEPSIDARGCAHEIATHYHLPGWR
jgi:hypothetical protein